MEILQLLGVAVGLASLAGFNLYLTVFLTGLAVRFHWIALAPDYARLEVLADPWILAASGLLFVMEFLADKIPWVDSVWDAVHTAIRPVGAALLGVMVLGDSNPVFNVVVALLAAWLGFTTHALKSTVRLQANASPEPFSNVALSLAEDVGVVAGVGLIFHYPLLALAVAIVFLAAVWFFVPRMLRATWVKLWLCTRKLRLAAEETPVLELPFDIPSAVRRAILSAAGADHRLVWAVSCISGAGSGYPRNRFGWLAMTDGPTPRMYFVPRRRRRPLALPPGMPSDVRVEPKFLADVLVLSWEGKSARCAFLFDRGSRALGRLVAEELKPDSPPEDAGRALG